MCVSVTVEGSHVLQWSVESYTYPQPPPSSPDASDFSVTTGSTSSASQMREHCGMEVSWLRHQLASTRA